MVTKISVNERNASFFFYKGVGGGGGDCMNIMVLLNINTHTQRFTNSKHNVY